MVKWEGVEAFDRWVSSFPQEAEAQMAAAVGKSADEFASMAKTAAPVSDLDEHPGALRDSIHVVDGRSSLSKRIVADALDKNGHQYGGHVEFGHRAHGVHVHAQPFWWPTWRLMRKRAMGRIKRAITNAVRKNKVGI